MEEILASIRRIIESNEPNAENAPPHPLSNTYEDDEISEQEEMGFAPDMAANDPGLDPGLPARSEPMNFASRTDIGGPALGQPARDQLANQPAQPERTLSLADVAARVRAASARQQEAGGVRFPGASTARAPSTPELAQPVRRQEPVAMPALREPPPMAPEARFHQPAPVAQPVAPQPEPLRRPARAIFEPVRPSAAAAEIPPRHETRQEPRLAPEPLPQGLPARIEETASLLSREAGAQVAKSFSDLAAVFNGMERRSLEDLAGDMLRPMLQEWLDDNLPTLVERLVREEIERVAHGTRR